MTIRHALISVSDKTGLLPFAQFLVAQGIELLSTGGTAKLLQQNNIPVRDVSDVTGFPEMMGGRVKTLHPLVHGGLLARRSEKEHMDAAKAHNIGMIDLLIVNLYPFETTLNSTTDYDTLVENIDIGGPAMIRAAAKNHESVTVIVDVADYELLQQTMQQNKNAIPELLRKKFAAKAFARTAAYDTLIASWLQNSLSPCGRGLGRGGLPLAKSGGEPPPPNLPPQGGEELSPWPAYLLDAKLATTLRYGENPHQAAALYQRLDAKGGLANATQLQGKELSYNNLADAEAAWQIVSSYNSMCHPGFAQQTPGSASAQTQTSHIATLIKHANPCGVATGATLTEAFTRALASDPVSAFGGILAINGTVDEQLVTAIGSLFLEVIIAHDFTAGARTTLAAKKNLRLLTAQPEKHASPLAGWMIQAISGGYLVQTQDVPSPIGGGLGWGPKDTKAAPHHGPLPTSPLWGEEWRTVTGPNPSAVQIADAALAWHVVKYVKSNAIVLVKNGATIGVGAGQMSRVDSVRIAIEKAKQHGHDPRGATLASDAFFPFADNVELAADAGISLIIQPGGSVRDPEVIDAANKHGITMLFTGTRHFRH